MRADHVAFRVADLDSAIEFYTGALGLRLLNREIDRKNKEAFAFLDLDGCRIELLMLLDESGDAVPYEPPSPAEPFCPHFAVSVDDLDAKLDEIVRNGAKHIKGPMEIPGKVTWAYVADPDGNVIELIRWHEPVGSE